MEKAVAVIVNNDRTQSDESSTSEEGIADTVDDAIIIRKFEKYKSKYQNLLYRENEANKKLKKQNH